METASILSWTLHAEIPVPADVQSLLTHGEQAVAAFKTFRDSATFTTKRLIVRDAQGMTGKKVEICSAVQLDPDVVVRERGHAGLELRTGSLDRKQATSKSNCRRASMCVVSTVSLHGPC